MDWERELSLGWILFNAIKGLKINPPVNMKLSGEWNGIAERVALVTAKLFSQIVNSNLEVRTSVSIDPMTGAAESGALFTYEAIPRTTWLWSDIIEDDYRLNDDGTGQFPRTDRQCQIERIDDKKLYRDNAGEPLGETWSRPIDVVRAGIKLVEYLGVGGMGTRGFGRMRLVADWEESNGSVR
jgi:CRISPR-associated protein Cmr4